MRFVRDRRGQSVVVGTVILFGFLILALSIYQVQFVPAENSEIEFEHSQEVEGDFLDLRNDVLSAGTTGAARSTSIRLGTRYPQRTFFLNPPAASGTLQTTESAEIRIEDALVDDGVHPNVQAFWDDSPEFDNGVPVFDTRSIRYTPNYNEYRGAPRLTYEHSLVAAEFDNSVLPRSGQTIVRDERISLTALTGSVSENGVEPRSVDADSVSQQRRTVPITGTNGEDIEIRLPSAVGDVQDFVNRTTVQDAEDVTVEGDEIVITLDGSESYRLGLSEVSVDGSGSTEPAYVVPVGGEEVTAGQTVGIEVRDKYNNPVDGANVVLSNATNRTTDSDGRVFFDPQSDGNNASINGGFDPDKPDYESVTFEVRPADGGGEGSINPIGGDNRVILDNVRGGQSAGVDNNEVELTLSNDAEEEITFSETAFNLYYDGQSIQNSFIIRPGGDNVELRGGFEVLSQPISFNPGEERTVTLEFNDDARGSMIGITFIDNKNRRTLYITGVPGPGGGPGRGGGN